MRKTTTWASLIMLAAMCSACSDQAQEETSEAANAIGSDIEQTGDNLANSASNAWNATSNAASDAGNAVENATD